MMIKIVPTPYSLKYIGHLVNWYDCCDGIYNGILTFLCANIQIDNHNKVKLWKICGTNGSLFYNF